MQRAKEIMRASTLDIFFSGEDEQSHDTLKWWCAIKMHAEQIDNTYEHSQLYGYRAH